MFVYKCSWLNAQIKFDIDFFVFWAIGKFFFQTTPAFYFSKWHSFQILKHQVVQRGLSMLQESYSRAGSLLSDHSQVYSILHIYTM